MSSIHPDLEVEPLPQDRLLAFIEAVGTATVEGHTFEICRSLSGMTTFSVIWPTHSSSIIMTGTRNSSARLKPVTVRSKHSCGEFGQRAMML